MSANVDMNQRPEPDQVLVDIAEYVDNYEITSDEAYDTARNCLIDTLGCGLLALRFPSAPSTWARSFPVRLSITAPAYPALPMYWTRSRPHGISAQWFAGWISTTPGLQPNGVTHQTISAASWPLPTT